MEPINLDAWRVERNFSRRADDEKIDQLCGMLLQAQKKIQELEAQLADKKSEIPKE